MEDGQFREAESEEQKSLPFNFRAPRLQLTQDKTPITHLLAVTMPDHCISQATNGKGHREGQQDIIVFIMDGSYRCTTKTANATGRSWKRAPLG